MTSWHEMNSYAMQGDRDDDELDRPCNCCVELVERRAEVQELRKALADAKLMLQKAMSIVAVEMPDDPGSPKRSLESQITKAVQSASKTLGNAGKRNPS